MVLPVCPRKIPRGLDKLTAHADGTITGSPGFRTINSPRWPAAEEVEELVIGGVALVIAIAATGGWYVGKRGARNLS